MNIFHTVLKWLIVTITVIVITNCGGGGGSPETNPNGSNPTNGNTINNNNGSNSEFDRDSYRGLNFYYKNMAPANYKLDQLTDSEFDQMSSDKQLKIADNLLSSLFFGYSLSDLKSKISDGNFLSTVRAGLEEDRTDKGWLEDHILDDSIFEQYKSSGYRTQDVTILSRFYAMKDLDKYFLNNWTAYILTQTIMFSPAYELSSSHTPDISGVYNRLVTMLENESGMRFMTYVHMMSQNNWRRFRSPEDNGREMIEIYLRDTNDLLVPLAGKALQNWKLNTVSDTLEIGLNRNTKEINELTDFFGGEAVITGEDFYRELAKSDRFTKGATRRLVDFFFPEKEESRKISITDSIVSSKPETWQDILLQIIFSKEYLLNNSRPKSAEETFYSLAKKMDFRNRRNTFMIFKNKLIDMHQATMKYKLGKIERVPLDSLSFAHYHKYIRDEVLLRYTDHTYNDPNGWGYNGWMPSFIDEERFNPDIENDQNSLEVFVDYLFESTIARKATNKEHELFRKHMIETRNGKKLFKNTFNMYVDRDDDDEQKRERTRRRQYIAFVVLDYISRLDEIYGQREVK